MSTIPGLSASNIYSYLSAMNAGSSTVNPTNYAALVQAAQLSAITTLTGSNPASPLTYNASGLLGTQPAAAITPNAATTPAQAAQNAYLQVEYAISQTLSSMISGSSDSSNSDLSSLFGLAGTTDINSLLGAPGTPSTTGTSAQAAQYAAINAQFALTQALNSLTSSTSSSGA